jgi:alpha-L-rhamnosidase
MSTLNLRATSATMLEVRQLRVNAVVNPKGVEGGNLRLSWQLDSDISGTYQVAYQIRVAQDQEALTLGQGDLWDSGKMDSDSQLVTYDGRAISSRARAFWQVQVWDNHGRVASSETAWWEMGLLRPSDWVAHWIHAETGAQRADRLAGMQWVRGPSASPKVGTKFRLVFEVPEACTGTLSLVGHGDPTIFFDGAKLASQIEHSVVGIGPTKECTYQLGPGRHVLAVELCDPRPDLLGVDDSALGFEGAEFAYLFRLKFKCLRPSRYVMEGWKTDLCDDKNWSGPHFNDAHWVPAVQVRERRPTMLPRHGAVLMRREFRVEKPVKRARLYCTSLGAYEIYINNKQATDSVLAPESSDFRRRAYYEVLDVTADIAVGANVVAVVVGDGWYASRIWITGRYPWLPGPRMLRVQLELTFQDNSTQLMCSDESWKVCSSAVVSSDIYDGEHYDARIEQPGWTQQGFDDRNWEVATQGDAPKIALSGLIGRPVRRTQYLRPISENHLSADRAVFDFGQNFSGRCRLQVIGKAGSKVELKFGELLKESGEVDQSNLSPARATDTFVLAGTGQLETYEPHFTYHGFRYVEVSGLAAPVSLTTLLGVVVHSDLSVTAGLEVANPLIQKLWDNTRWSQRSNFMGVPTDCPQRGERLAWLGDANVFWEAAAIHMDVQEFTERFMRTIQDAQTAGGAFPDFAPATFKFRSTPSGKLKVLADWNADSRETYEGAAPGWADGGISLPWTVWRQYGDPQIIEENWTAMSRYLALIEAKNPNHLWQNGRGGDFGDWLSLDERNQTEPEFKELVATCLWSGSIKRMEEMALATSRSKEALHYRSLWKAVKAGFVRAFVRNNGFIGNGSQSSQVLGLYFGLVPDALRRAAAQVLAEDIEARQGALSTGFLSTPHIPDVLADEGYASLAYSLLLRQEFPSWGYMIAQGATSIWENWSGYNGKIPCSRNHYALGAVCGFLFRRMAGISPADAGYKRIAMAPLPDSRIGAVKAQFNSVRGLIALEWEYVSARIIGYKIGVPPNTSAILNLRLTERARVPGLVETMRRLRVSDGDEIGQWHLTAGSYEFTVEY